MTQYDDAYKTLERIAKVMGCEPEDDDDLVEAVVCLASEAESWRETAKRHHIRAILAETKLAERKEAK